MRVSQELGLKDPIMLEPYMFLTGDLAEEPVFPGSKIYSIILAYIRVDSQFGAIYNSQARRTWINPWQVHQGFLNPLQVKATITELRRIALAFRGLADALNKEMPELLHSFTAHEWIGKSKIINSFFTNK